MAFLGRNGLWVVEVRLERALVAWFDVGDAFTDCDDFEAEFVSRSAGEREERELSEITGKVSATDAHAMSSDQCFARSGCFDVGKINSVDRFNVGEFDSERHEKSN